jgi:hypothetical protein
MRKKRKKGKKKKGQAKIRTFTEKKRHPWFYRSPPENALADLPALAGLSRAVKYWKP